LAGFRLAGCVAYFCWRYTLDFYTACCVKNGPSTVWASHKVKLNHWIYYKL